jgi:hypothetical protein
MSIARFDRCIDRIGGLLALNLPQSQPNCGHDFAIDGKRYVSLVLIHALACIR